MKKILGIGNALVDIMTQLDNDTLLAEFELPKGSMQLVDKDKSEHVNSNTGHLKKDITSGGSAANTINGLANLGTTCGYIGKVGKDDFGDFFEKDLRNNNIQPILFKTETETGVAMALVSPDSERTFATYLGAAVELSASDLSEKDFEGYDIVHIEGYLVFNNELLERAMKLAQKAGLKISLDLASYNVVEANLDFLKKVAIEYVDIIFANEEEAKAFTGKEPEEALNEIAKGCEIAVVKVGAKGSFIKKDGIQYKADVIHATAKDTTGAGDFYASGFLYGLTKNLSMEKCGAIGSILSGKVIEVMGAKMTAETWIEIKRMVAEVEG
ncbi:MAG: adenosine kinase [Bacteroidales bacterium]|nr:adenosine kinase [Bacteroidales bacterium]MCF8456324.1 adenosine kinase [Bacteroidales bacterium]